MPARAQVTGVRSCFAPARVPQGTRRLASVECLHGLQVIAQPELADAMPLGHIAAAPGHERLRGRHLRMELAGPLAPRLMVALALGAGARD